MKGLKLLVLVASLLCIQAAIAEVVTDEGTSVANQSTQIPLNQKNNDTTYWFEDIEGDHTVYWELIEAYDVVKKSLVKVARHLKCYVTDLKVVRNVSEDDDCSNYS